jgi:uncharacterized cofD-like protein
MHRVRLSPSGAAPSPGVLESIRGANVVLVGPGSLFTSILPVLLVSGVADAIRACPGERVLVANLMTQPGETLGMSLRDHLDALDRHIGPDLVRHVLVHDRPLDPDRLAPYVTRGSVPVPTDSLDGRSERVISASLVTGSGKIRHDPGRVARALLALLDARSGLSKADGEASTGPRPSSARAVGEKGIH